MDPKRILAALAGGISQFVLGGIVYGVMLEGFMKAHTNQIPGLMKEPMLMWPIVVANLCVGILFAWLFKAMNVTKFVKGMYWGIFIGLMFGLSFDLYIYSGMNIYSDSVVMIVDIVATVVLSAIGGGIVALVLGTGKKEAK